MPCRACEKCERGVFFVSKTKGRHLPYSISQNFLTSTKTIRRLLNKTDIASGDTVLEIGAGKGHITKPLSNRCKTVIAYEIDKRLVQSLGPQLPPNVDLICADFLDAPLPKKPYKVFASIPFSQTTAIIQKLTTSTRLPADMWLVMERGAAKRFSGAPRDNLHSLLLKPFFETEIIHQFDRNDFHPAPKVDVVLLAFKQKRAPDILPEQRRDFSVFLTYSLRHGLFGSRALLTPKQIATALRLARLPQIERTGDVLYVQWLCLFRCWVRFKR